jgi:gliding motility-associated-like protein
MVLKLRSFSLVALVLGLAPAAWSQLVVNAGVPAATVVQDILVGEGVVISNITFSGDADQIGTFDAANSNILVPDGMIMATGTATVAIGPNNIGSQTTGGGNFQVGDPDLQAISTVAMNDAAILEFDFVPNGDSISFNYSFGSEEYNEYVCGTVNDAFGFFLSGPGISGPFSNGAVNLAIIPGTTIPVTINTVNNGSVGSNGSVGNCTQVSPQWNQNTEFYVDNANNTTPTSTQLDGFTVVLQAAAQVQCGLTYHLKIAIADGGDTAFDSAVFIESGSFSSNGFDITASASIDGNQIFLGDTTVVESCNNAVFQVIRPDNTTQDTIVVTISGTAENGVDYAYIDPEIVMEVGQNIYDIPLNVIADGVAESPETVTIEYLYVNLCGDSILRSSTLVIMDFEPILLDYDDPVGICDGIATLEVTPVQGYGPFSYQWDTGTEDTLAVNVVAAAAAGDAVVVVTDVCGNTVSATVGYEPPPPFDIAVTQGDDPFCPGDPVALTAVVESGAGPYSWSWSTGGTNETTTVNLLTSSTVTLNGEDGCGQDASANWFVEVPSYDPIVAVSDTACLYVESSVDIEGGTGNFWFYTLQITYDAFGMPIDTAVVELNDGLDSLVVFVGPAGIFIAGDDEGLLEITAVDQCGTEANFELVLEACDTFIPNIISPNNDSSNDYFRIPGIEGFPGSRLLIFNRWGNLLFTDENYQGAWDGRVNGLELGEGTYYYVLNRSDGKDFHGSLTIVR